MAKQEQNIKKVTPKPDIYWHGWLDCIDYVTTNFCGREVRSDARFALTKIKKEINERIDNGKDN